MQIRLVRPAVEGQVEVKIPGAAYRPARDPVGAMHQLDLSSAELNWITTALKSLNSMADGAENTHDLFSRLEAYCDDNGTGRRPAGRDAYRNIFYPA